MKNKIITNSEQETYDFALKFAEKLAGGEVLALSGDLGAGKTVFARGLAHGLGYDKNVNSPTFVIMKNYNVGKSHIKEFVHIDAYRLERGEELEAIGAQDYLGKSDVVVVIEWPENIKSILPNKTIFINISNLDEQRREITY